MPSLDNRITALEQKAQHMEAPAILIRFVSMDAEQEPLTVIRYGKRVWTIQPGETEQEFQERAKGEAVPEPGHTCAVLLAD